MFFLFFFVSLRNTLFCNASFKAAVWSFWVFLWLWSPLQLIEWSSLLYNGSLYTCICCRHKTICHFCGISYPLNKLTTRTDVWKETEAIRLIRSLIFQGKNIHTVALNDLYRVQPNISCTTKSTWCNTTIFCLYNNTRIIDLFKITFSIYHLNI